MKNDKVERRALAGIELRATEGQPNVLRGYAAMFEKRSLDLGGFVEVIRKGAFSRSLKSSMDVLALAHHDTSRPLARRSAGTLTIQEDDTGLLVEITLADTTHARDVLADVRARNIEGMSFMFITKKDSWTRSAPGEPAIRELIDVDLFEVSAVTVPAFPDTSIAARSMPTDTPSLATAENMERLNGLSMKLLDLPI